MIDPATIQYLWRYMVHADKQVLAAAATVPRDAYDRDQHISWGSVHKLLVHSASAQQIWLRRLEGKDSGRDLNPRTIGHEELTKTWASIHDALLAFAGPLSPESLSSIVRSRTRAGTPFELPLGVCMLHVSDHATYHRGQINSMIKLAGGAPSPVMLISYARAGEVIT